MPTPPKPTSIIRMEGKSHRTKRELREREQAEKNLLTGSGLKETKEVKENPRAHKEFLRVKKLLKSIDKADDLYGGAINRYCMLMAECADFEEKQEKISQQQRELEARKAEMDFLEYLNLSNGLSKTLLGYDKQLQTKRKMLLDIEKENVMTIASSLRSIPKKQEKKANPLKEALGG